ncbi:MAG: hypothetical protein JSS84_02530, partial [Bacteroidetes bacterium]|nr:hypothetical protein [Bacteroidota bacterium]
MQYAQKFLLVAAAALIVVLGCASGRKTPKMAATKQDPAWAKIDSLANLGQYATALAATEALLAGAQEKQ